MNWWRIWVAICICGAAWSVTGHRAQIDDLERRLAALEKATPPAVKE